MDFVTHISLYSLNAEFTVTPEVIEFCDLETLPLSFTLNCVVDPAGVIAWEVTGVTPPLEVLLVVGKQ